MRRIMITVFLFSFISFFSSARSFADGSRESNLAPVVSMPDNEMLSKKLDKITESQSKILNELDEIKAELQIVKIRVTQRS